LIVFVVKNDIQGRFFREEMVGTKSAHYIHQKVVDRPMLGMLKFADILQFIVNTFDNGPFAEHDLIGL